MTNQDRKSLDSRRHKRSKARRSLPRALLAYLSETAAISVVAQIHLDLRQFDLALLFHRSACIVNLFPISPAATACPAGIGLHFPLAFDAGGAIRKSI